MGAAAKGVVTNAYAVCSEFEISKAGKPVESLDLRDFVLDKVDVRQLFQVVDVLDVFDVVEAEVETGELLECL